MEDGGAREAQRVVGALLVRVRVRVRAKVRVRVRARARVRVRVRVRLRVRVRVRCSSARVVGARLPGALGHDEGVRDVGRVVDDQPDGEHLVRVRARARVRVRVRVSC